MNALISAARFGTAVEDAIVYSTLRPCFDCTKALLQAKAHTIYYIHDWQHPVLALQEQYKLVQDKFPGGVRPLLIDDAEADWANGKVAPVTSSYTQGNGHTHRV
jgi:dCMP deaminase